MKKPDEKERRFFTAYFQASPFRMIRPFQVLYKAFFPAHKEQPSRSPFGFPEKQQFNNSRWFTGYKQGVAMMKDFPGPIRRPNPPRGPHFTTKVMTTLEKLPGCTFREFAEMNDTTEPAAARYLQNMADRDLVEWESINDRSHYFLLTHNELYLRLAPVFRDPVHYRITQVLIEQSPKASKPKTTDKSQPPRGVRLKTLMDETGIKSKPIRKHLRFLKGRDLVTLKRHRFKCHAQPKDQLRTAWRKYHESEIYVPPPPLPLK